MWPRFSVFQLFQSRRLRLARAMNVVHTYRRVIVPTAASAIDARHLTSDSFSDRVISAELLSASCANLRSQMLSERC